MTQDIERAHTEDELKPASAGGRNIKLIIAYDGAGFCGWQKQQADFTQPKENTDAAVVRKPSVQGTIEQALKKIHGLNIVNLTGSGRTDTGVHAAGQAANFYSNIDSIPAERFASALNSLLPKDVRIISSCEEGENFHARFSAYSRTYRYQFICGRRLLPNENHFNLHLNCFPDIRLLNAYGRLLLGEKDCSIFSGSGDASKSKHRYIYNAVFFIEGNRLIFEITANAFLRKMVRSITGTFLHYGEKGTPPEKLSEIIASQERSLAGPTLPPQGLFLWKVDYGKLNK
ncbi:MAG: tRNA pseudouridine(38-40) synthase TruA [Treponema sp.]|jgi:tRNA pseudouridine38-40 synthase|nr:tRNA pseudouridine(38-40) synthase TruA [Treponema sp.]